MVTFAAVIQKFGVKAEKTGWTYILIPSQIAQQIKPGCKRSYRVKGKLDNHPIEKISILPAGEGDFILPLNKTMRNKIKKPLGAVITVHLAEDKRDLPIDADLLACLQEEPAAILRFNSLAPSHQRYFSKWISDAKTEQTRAKRIAITVNAMINNQDFGEALRSAARDKIV